MKPLVSTVLTTYASNSVFTFTVNFEHEVPNGGYIRFDLPSAMSIKAPAQIADECYRQEGESVDNLECVAGQDKTYFDIKTNL